MLTEYLEKGENLILIIYVSPQGALTPINDFPPTSKNKVQSKLSNNAHKLLGSVVVIMLPTCHSVIVGCVLREAPCRGCEEG